ncbi:hypothetical protein RB195_008496 [Necator americanus]|uniref:Uncharacterized protein n=1 Tax=Necator americanus TaxID=51031 RepID=A0ABR1CNY4_NECAM
MYSSSKVELNCNGMDENRRLRSKHKCDRLEPDPPQVKGIWLTRLTSSIEDLFVNRGFIPGRPKMKEVGVRAPTIASMAPSTAEEAVGMELGPSRWAAKNGASKGSLSRS